MFRKYLMISYPYFAAAGDSGGGDIASIQSDVATLEEGDTPESDKEESDEKEEESSDKVSGKARETRTSERSREDKTDSAEKEEESDKEEESSKEEEDEFGKEFEEDLTEEEEEKDKEEEPLENEFTVRALKKEFPEIFKKFPEVKDAIFRERAFTKIFGSVEEAEDASNKAAYLDEISQQLYEGRADELVGALKKTGDESLRTFAFNFLPALQSKDKDLFYELNDYVVNRVLHAASNSAEKNGNKNLGYAVKYLAQFIFGEPELPELKQVKPKEKSQEELRLEEREREIEQKYYADFETSVHTSARDRMTKIIKEGLDPDNTMSDFTRDALTDKIIEEVGVQIAKDQIFQSQLSALWKRAAREGFNREAKSRIISAYLARARKIVPSVRGKIRKEAGIRNNNTDRQGKRMATTSGGDRKFRTIPSDPKKIDWKKVTDEDILAAD